MKDSFVYIWNNKTNNKKYIGYHKGSIDDGYICSSHNAEFWNDYNNPNMIFERDIVFEGTREECLIKEQEILKNIDISDEMYYNNARGSSINFTTEIKNKMSKSHKKWWDNLSDEKKIERAKKISEAKRGVPRSEETRKKISESNKGKIMSEDARKKISEANKGKNYHSDEHKKNLSDKMRGNTYGKMQTKEAREQKRKRFLENNPGKNKTDEHIKKISEGKKGSIPWNKGKKRKQIECPHCGKTGGDGLMQRWHFNNCKYK